MGIWWWLRRKQCSRVKNIDEESQWNSLGFFHDFFFFYLQGLYRLLRRFTREIWVAKAIKFVVGIG